MTKIENYQTFDLGGVLHSYFEILGMNTAHDLFSLVPFKYMIYHGGTFAKRLYSLMARGNIQHGKQLKFHLLLEY
jgi:hypothetical protein